LPRLALNHNPPDLCLLSSWDSRHDLPCPDTLLHIFNTATAKNESLERKKKPPKYNYIIDYNFQIVKQFLIPCTKHAKRFVKIWLINHYLT
jgi:hypothetical protein